MNAKTRPPTGLDFGTPLLGELESLWLKDTGYILPYASVMDIWST